MQTSRRYTARADCYWRIKARIKVSVRELSDTLKISATPINSAIRTLVSEGFLVAIPRKGVVVSDICEMSLKQILYFCSSLEGLAAYFAAENATHEELNQIENFLGQAQLAIKCNDTSALKEAHGGFHSSIKNASHSTFLVNQISTYQSSANCIHHDEQNCYENLHIIYNEHVAIFQALEDRNGPLTEPRMVDHIRNNTNT